MKLERSSSCKCSMSTGKLVQESELDMLLAARIDRAHVEGRARDMQVSTSNVNQNQVTLRGQCPHCRQASAFLLVTSLGATPNGHRVGGLQCQACMDCILGIFAQDPYSFKYVKHLPFGLPNDKVAEEIPEHIREDFKEALRCLHVDAYNATAEMCRRAVEASCIDLGVPLKIKVLGDMIDHLEVERKITPHMRDVAHKIRLGGNRGAHPPETGPKPPEQETPPDAPVEKIGKDHAEAIVDYTRQFLHHVYVVPKQLDKYDFSKPKVPKA